MKAAWSTAAQWVQLHINASLNRPPDRTWRRPPGRPRTSGSTSYETIPPVRLESSGARRAVDRGHGGATTRRPSPATRP